MSKSNKLSNEEASQLADAIAGAKLVRLSSTASASVSPPSSASAPYPAETQRIGSLVIPRLLWAYLEPHGESAVRMRLGGDLIEIQAKGHWEPPRPKDKSPKLLPDPKPRESYQSYFLRVLLLCKGRPRPAGNMEWIANRKWVGESSEQLRDAIAAGRDLPSHEWKFLQEP